MKKEFFERAQTLRWQIDCLKELAEPDHQLRYTRIFEKSHFDYSDHLPSQLNYKVCEWDSQLKDLIYKEIAALEEEFAELSDETMTDNK